MDKLTQLRELRKAAFKAAADHERDMKNDPDYRGVVEREMEKATLDPAKMTDAQLKGIVLRIANDGSSISEKKRRSAPYMVEIKKRITAATGHVFRKSFAPEGKTDRCVHCRKDFMQHYNGKCPEETS